MRFTNQCEAVGASPTHWQAGFVGKRGLVAYPRDMNAIDFEAES
jgi:hypothetical protein